MTSVSFEQHGSEFKFRLSGGMFSSGEAMIIDSSGRELSFVRKGKEHQMKLPFIDLTSLLVASEIFSHVVKALKDQDAAAPREHKVLESNKIMANTLVYTWDNLRKALEFQLESAKDFNEPVLVKVISSVIRDMDSNKV